MTKGSGYKLKEDIGRICTRGVVDVAQKGLGDGCRCGAYVLFAAYSWLAGRQDWSGREKIKDVGPSCNLVK